MKKDTFNIGQKIADRTKSTPERLKTPSDAKLR